MENRNLICDLHTHSVFSDGTYTPAQLIKEAEHIGLSAIALTDHNTVSGLPEFMKAGSGSKVEAIPGVEFSTDYGDKELHIVALFVRPEYFNQITALVSEAHRRKEKSNIALIESLRRAGYELSYEDIKAKTPGGQVNRAHIGEALTELGYTSSIKEAFKTLLSPKCGYYQPPKRIDVFVTIEFIRSIHAVPILAHPFLNLTEAELRAFLPVAKHHGLAAMETIYSTYDEETTELARSIADEFGLKHSGGSDFHGTKKPDIALGRGRGNLLIPLTIAKQLKAEMV